MTYLESRGPSNDKGTKFSKIRPFFDTQMLSEYFTFLRKNEINGVFKKIQKNHLLQMLR